MLIDEIKAQLADIEARFTTPLESLDAILVAETKRIDESIGADIEALQNQIDVLQNDLMVKQGEYETEMASLQQIIASKEMVTKLKEALAQV